MDEQSDEELMLCYQMGDEASFTSIYLRYSARVLAFIQKKVGNESLAQDIFQATFLKFHRSRSQYLPKYLLSQWIFTICKSELIDSLRKNANSRLDFPERLPEPEIVEVHEVNARELSGLEKLPMVQKQALDLRYFEEKTFEEIAGKLETTTTNARKLVSRAIKSLRSANYGKEK